MATFFKYVSGIVILSLICRFGSDNLVVDKIARNVNSIKKQKIILSRYFSAIIITSIFFSIIILFSTIVLSDESLLLFMLYLVISSTSLALTNLYCEYYRGMGLPLHSTCFRFLITPTILIVSVLTINVTNILEVIQLYTLALLGNFIPILIVNNGLLYFKITFRQLGNLYAESFPLLIVALCGLYFGWIDLLVLDFFTTSYEVAYYGTVLKISSAYTFVSSSIIVYSSSIISRMIKRKHYDELKHYYLKLSSFGLLLGLIVYITISYLLFDLSKFINYEYEKLDYMFNYLSAAHIINIVCGPVGYTLIALGRKEFFAKSYTLVTILFQPLFFYLILSYDARGASYNAVVLFAVINMLCVVRLIVELKKLAACESAS